MTTTKRIMSIDARALAKLLAWTYGILTTLGAVVLLFTQMDRITYPLGFMVPGFHLNLNLNLPLTSNPLGRILTVSGMVLAYVMTGWISGYLLAGLLNLVARHRGGIPVTIVEVTEVAPARTPSSPGVDHNQLSS
jgi:hypothetical protein